MLVILG